LTEKRTRTLKEEKRIAEERDKLVDRRKALSSLGNYKLQQAAGKEIDHSSKELDIHESTVLAMLDEVESHTLALKDVDSLLAQRHEQYTAREAEVAATLSNFEQRQSDYIAERTELAKKIPAPSMAIYEQVRKRFPTDPVVLLNNHSAPGVLCAWSTRCIQISRGQAFLGVGCGRILHLGKSDLGPP
jgi:predicted  nucleic acid-binding Zn-ribbon protein